MPALDQCHTQVVNALRKEGWNVNPNPFRLVVDGERTVYLDLKATRLNNGAADEALFAEIKCFPDPHSLTREIYLAIGQYLIYRTCLETVNLRIPLYLTIPQNIYQTRFDQIVLKTLSDSKIKTVIVDLEQERVIQWNE